MRNLVHKVGFIVLITLTLIILSVLVFPLFIALLPLAIKLERYPLNGRMTW